MSLSLYLHIPFCEVKCGYCDFFSVPRGYEDFDLQKEYVSQLIREIDVRSPEFSGREIRSIFFGGGTPSLLDPKLLEKIFSALSNHFSWESRTEVTLETNPKTVSFERLRAFRSLGVNRLSIGVQSFQDRFLRVMGRIHTGTESRKTVEDGRRAGFENVSCDLIFALPGQSFADWAMDLNEAIGLGTDHLSAYHLTIEKRTPFETLHRDGRLNLPPEEEGVRMLTWTRDQLCQARMEPYEISNFSKPGFESVHNRNYWQYGEYLGFGTAAASFVHRVRRHNVKNLKKYLEEDILDFNDVIDRPTAMGEFCMLALRTREGIEGGRFLVEFGLPLMDIFSKQLSRWKQRGWLESIQESWRLTQEGFLFADEIASSFLPDPRLPATLTQSIR